MRVLITGGAGFIGSHATRWFRRRHPDWDILTIDRLSYAADLKRINDLVRPKTFTRDGIVEDYYVDSPPLRFIYHDLRAPITDMVHDDLGELDYVLHFAAETHVDRSMVDPLPFVESNVMGTFNLLEYCRLFQPKLRMFFMVSTDETYGPAPAGTDHREDAPHRPSNPYSATKAAAEDLAYAWDHSMGVPVIVTNTMNNIGEGQHPEKYVPKIVRSIREGLVVPVHGSPDQPGSRKYLYAEDHASAIEFLMRNGRRGERYNVVGAEEVDNLEMVRRVERVMGKEAKVRFVDFHRVRPGHDLRYSLDGSKMSEMGWEPEVTVNQALQRIVASMAEVR